MTGKGHVRHLWPGRDGTLKIRLDTGAGGEEEQLKAAAAREDLGLATWAREVLLAAADTGEDDGTVRYRRSEAPNPVLLRNLAEARSSLAAIGNNLNQIAKATNTEQPVEAAQARAVFNYVVERVDRIDDAVAALLGRRP